MILESERLNRIASGFLVESGNFEPMFLVAFASSCERIERDTPAGVELLVSLLEGVDLFRKLVNSQRRRSFENIERR